jgi:hypothetical protein
VGSGCGKLERESDTGDGSRKEAWEASAHTRILIYYSFSSGVLARYWVLPLLIRNPSLKHPDRYSEHSEHHTDDSYYHEMPLRGPHLDPLRNTTRSRVLELIIEFKETNTPVPITDFSLVLPPIVHASVGGAVEIRAGLQ